MQNRAYTIWHKLFITTMIIGAVLILAKTTSVRAQITPLLNFAGKVTNVDGSELADGTYDFNFALYTQATGGAAIWSENLTSATRFSGTIASATENVSSVTYTYTGASATTSFRVGQYLTNASTSEAALVIDFNQSSSSVTVASGSPVWSAGQPINNRPHVEGGVVNINFGSVSDLSGVDFNQNLYLEVTFNGEVMQPRKIIVPVVQAYVAEKVGDKTEAELAGLADNETIAGEWSFNNIVSLASSTSSSVLTIIQNGNGNIAEFKTATGTVLTILNDGRVTIGDYTFPADTSGSSPGYVLKIDGSGNLSWSSDIAGAGGSGLWASSTGYVYPVDTSQIIVIGNNSTSSIGNIFEVTGNAYISGALTAQSLSLTNDLSVADGGTGISTIASQSLLYASGLDTIAEFTVGGNGEVLSVSGGQLIWATTSIPMPHDILSVSHANTEATTTLARGDLLVVNSGTLWGRMSLGTNGYILYSDGTDATWSTTTAITALGTVNFGAWEADIIGAAYGGLGANTASWDGLAWANGAGTWSATGTLSVPYGGTGFSSIINQSLVYASSDDVLSSFTIGNEGEVLAVVGGNLSWATTSAPSSHGILSVSHSDTEATSTLVRGDLMVVNSNTNWSRLGIGANGYILYSNGTDTQWSTTTAITALGSITMGTWLANTIDIAYGGTGATTATGTRENLDLDEAYKFGVNSTGTVGWLWQSDGDGRGQWVATSSLGLGTGSVNQSKFIGTTTETTNGEIATTTLRGYEAANYICNAEYTGSYFCRTYDILVSIEQDDISTWDGSAWIAEGPPGYTSNSNDCNGWIASSSVMLGAFWVFDDDGGGAGWLTNCSGEKSLACCER